MTQARDEMESTPQPILEEDPEDLDGGDIVITEPTQFPDETPEPSSEPEETSEPDASPTPSPTPPPSAKYMLEVDVTNQIVTVFGQDSEGNYSKVVKRMICSTGKPSTPTPLGTYKLPGGRYDRGVWGYFTKFDVWARYFTRIKGSYLFHSVIYAKNDVSTFKQSTVNALGTPVSAGCIRLTVQDAKWIFDNAKPGTTVKIVQKKRDTQLAKSVRAASLGVVLPVSMRVTDNKQNTLTKVQLKAGEAIDIKALVTYSDKNEKDQTSNIKWSFNNQELQKSAAISCRA